MREGQREQEILGKIYEIWMSGDEVLELEMGTRGVYGKLMFANTKKIRLQK